MSQSQAMDYEYIEGRIKFRRGTSGEWSFRNPVLLDGEPGYEADTGKFKIGNGIDTWQRLDYFLAKDADTPSDVSEAMFAIQQHIASETPHPVYDDGPSLLLLYKNAKV